MEPALLCGVVKVFWEKSFLLPGCKLLPWIRVITRDLKALPLYIASRRKMKLWCSLLK
jgi:hypothetical protein